MIFFFSLYEEWETFQLHVKNTAQPELQSCRRFLCSKLEFSPLPDVKDVQKTLGKNTPDRTIRLAADMLPCDGLCHSPLKSMRVVDLETKQQFISQTTFVMKQPGLGHIQADDFMAQ